MSQWIILRTAPQRERWVAHELRRGLGLSTYVPVERVKITNGRKSLERIVPLMRGYCFAGVVEAFPLADIAATNHVHGWLAPDDPERPAVITQSEIDRIRDLEQALNEERKARPRGHQIGDRVRVAKGAFQSMETLITAIRGSKASISVPILGTYRNVTVPLDALEPAA